MSLQKIFARIATLEAMKVENQVRLMSGHSPAYDESAFLDIAAELESFSAQPDENKTFLSDGWSYDRLPVNDAVTRFLNDTGERRNDVDLIDRRVELLQNVLSDLVDQLHDSGALSESDLVTILKGYKRA